MVVMVWIVIVIIVVSVVEAMMVVMLRGYCGSNNSWGCYSRKGCSAVVLFECCGRRNDSLVLKVVLDVMVEVLGGVVTFIVVVLRDEMW